MPRNHVVQQGETLPEIASRYGIGDHRLVYEAPDNADLRRRRPNPNVLAPGDVVVIPDAAPKAEGAQTGRAASYSVKLPKPVLRIVLQDHGNKPLANEPYVFAVKGQTARERSTDGSGKLEEPIPDGAHEATLRVRGRAYRVLVGFLNPMKDAPDGGISGVQARLKNLGYYGGPIDGRETDVTRLAIALYQQDAGLPVDGKANAGTLRKLEQQHGA